MVDKWSKSLKYLFLEHNELLTFPRAEGALLEHLDLSWNCLEEVPPAVCQMTTLQTLHLSGNEHIHEIPVEFGRLTKLTVFKYQELVVSLNRY